MVNDRYFEKFKIAISPQPLTMYCGKILQDDAQRHSAPHRDGTLHIVCMPQLCPYQKRQLYINSTSGFILTSLLSLVGFLRRCNKFHRNRIIRGRVMTS